MTNAIRLLRCLAVTFAWLLPLVAAAQPTETHVRFSKLYSTMDGQWQGLQLDIVAVGTTPLALGGRTLTVRDTRGQVRSRVLPATWDGPVRRSRMLLAEDTLDGWGLDYGYADLAFGAHFLPNDGGTITLEGMDEWTFGPLPTDGRSALARDGSVVPSIFERYVQGAMYPDFHVDMDYPRLFVREFHHAGMDHYFWTASRVEIELLENGAVPGWTPTTGFFHGYARQLLADDPAYSTPLCRFLFNYSDGYSHIISADDHECAILRASGSATLESDAVFHGIAADPDTGACPNAYWEDSRAYGRGGSMHPMMPLYRIWNGKAHANHRYVTSKSERDRMVSKGWVSEGYGPDGVAFCTDYLSPYPE